MPSSNATVVVFADADDSGVARLVKALDERTRVVWWRFGLPEGSVSVEVGEGEFRLEQPDALVRSVDLREAPIVVHRRRLMQPRPLVASELAEPADRTFSEREWGSLLDGLLLTAEREGDQTWLNSPSASLIAGNKLSLLLRAARGGVPVPPFTVSTPVRFPPGGENGIVAKAISADERIDAERYFSTALLSDEDLARLPGARLSTPSLLQRFVHASTEVRVFFALGEFLALELDRPAERVDIRFATLAELAPRAFELPGELRRALAELASGLGLGYCAFDLVLPDDERPQLVDITPNGDWDYFERPEEPLITDFLADAILRQVSSAASMGGRRS